MKRGPTAPRRTGSIQRILLIAVVIRHLSMRFGGIVAVNDLSFEAGPAPGSRAADRARNGGAGQDHRVCILQSTGFYKPRPGGTMQLTHEGPFAGRESRLETAETIFSDLQARPKGSGGATFQETIPPCFLLPADDTAPGKNLNGGAAQTR